MEKTFDLRALLDSCGVRMISLTHYFGRSGAPLPPVDGSRLELLRGSLEDAIEDTAMRFAAWCSLKISDSGDELLLAGKENCTERQGEALARFLPRIIELRVAAFLSKETFAGTSEDFRRLAEDTEDSLLQLMLSRTI